MKQGEGVFTVQKVNGPPEGFVVKMSVCPSQDTPIISILRMITMLHVYFYVCVGLMALRL